MNRREDERYVSECLTTTPSAFETPLQELTYRALAELEIPCVRVETDEAITMEDCRHINERLALAMVKTIFLATRNGQRIFLFVPTGGKPFHTTLFSDALAVPRVSFAPATMRETMLGTKVGAATVFSALLDGVNKVSVVIDRDVANQEWYGCSDGTTTGYMKVKTEQIIGVFLPHANHTPAIIEI